MKRTTLEKYRKTGTPVTVRHGRHAGATMVVIDVGYEPNPQDLRTAIPARDGSFPRVGLALYRPLARDWVPHTALLRDVICLEEWEIKSTAQKVREAQERLAIEDAARTLRQALQERRVRGRVSVDGARVLLRLTASQAWDLARTTEGASR